MKKSLKVIALFFFTGLVISCSTSKSATDVPSVRTAYDGVWTITDIKANLPAGYRVNNLFDEAPHADFLNSLWTMEKNGNGYFELKDGNRQLIFWSLHRNDSLPQLQLKKLEEGQKAKDVTEGYRLRVKEKLLNSFILEMPVPLENAANGNIRLTFTKT